MSVTKMIGKVDVLENGQQINLLPKGDNVFGLPVDQPGPIVLSNEPERSLRPGPQMPEKTIKVNPITGQQTFQYDDVKEGVKDGYSGAFKFDTGDYEKGTGDHAEIKDIGQHPIELSDELESAMYDDQINYKPSYYNEQNENNQPYMHRKSEYPLQAKPHVCPDCGTDFLEVQEAEPLNPGEHWVTINGTHVKIKPGESASQALARVKKEKPISLEPEKLMPEKNPISLEPKPLIPVDFDAAANNYSTFIEKTRKKNFSFDPADNKAYNVKRKDDAVNFYKKFADGEHELFIVAVTNHAGQLSHESHAAYEEVKGQKKYPLIGHWASSKTGFDYTDVSFPLDHGTSDAEARLLGAKYGQESIVSIKPNGKVRFIDV